jgi:hypothetical protein
MGVSYIESPENVLQVTTIITNVREMTEEIYRQTAAQIIEYWIIIMVRNWHYRH